MRKERERHAAQTAGLNSELDSLKELLKTYETSSKRKDEVYKQYLFAFTCTCAGWVILITCIVELPLGDESVGLFLFFGMFLFQVIVNLSQVLDKQKEKLEKMRAFTQWRLKHTEAKEEVN